MTPTPDEIVQPYASLYEAIEWKTSPDNPILLAHYTSVQVVEQILKNDEIWFANPLYMNDLEELRLGLLIGNQVFPEFADRVGGTAERGTLLTNAYNHYFAHLTTEAALDTYIFCLSEHPVGNTDGRLSMWREYGSKGNGAALVINTQRLHYLSHSPVLLAKVSYKNGPEREQAIRAGLENWAKITESADLADDQLYLAALAAFGFVKTLALVTKHAGFDEEREWRAVYVPERDPFGYLKPCLDYFVGPRGVEPKLKYKFGATYVGEQARATQSLTTGALADIIELVLLGPSVSSPLAKASFIRMLERNGKSAFRDRVFSSTIPLRPAL
ncbi:hypothetical protein AOQ72_19115 [Bradyrhizobium yuanmingense]|uniref:DUF2971 domain-containing protein n=1 Tax=Bradyrhizobium yuanmingense TaxID=108015 RepID=A0A0R3CFU3_9BRAD|nr:DUF2971 domain-containing protein [Bradyrhizobium yuanmingense]KRP96416.1 hypothetical protein AOQ72_19115 [Bradyrhizobium yuanmingense]